MRSGSDSASGVGHLDSDDPDRRRQGRAITHQMDDVTGNQLELTGPRHHHTLPQHTRYDHSVLQQPLHLSYWPTCVAGEHECPAAQIHVGTRPHRGTPIAELLEQSSRIPCQVHAQHSRSDLRGEEHDHHQAAQVAQRVDRGQVDLLRRQLGGRQAATFELLGGDAQCCRLRCATGKQAGGRTGPKQQQPRDQQHQRNRDYDLDHRKDEQADVTSAQAGEELWTREVAETEDVQREGQSTGARRHLDSGLPEHQSHEQCPAHATESNAPERDPADQEPQTDGGEQHEHRMLAQEGSDIGHR